MKDNEFNYEINEDKIIVINNENEVIAQIDFIENEEGVFDITHTYVSDKYRGQGIAGKLVEMAYNEIKQRGGKAVPKCSYAQVWFENHVYNKN